MRPTTMLCVTRSPTPPREAVDEVVLAAHAAGHLLALKSVARELQCPAVLGHRADDLIRSASGQLCLDLEGHRDLRAHLTGQMRDHLVGNATGVAANTRGVEAHRAVETSQCAVRRQR
jgi:hypothetical protein